MHVSILARVFFVYLISYCLQLDPPESQVMYLKSANLHFLFNAAWLLSGSKY